MITTRTAALLAAMSLVGAVTPAAFGQVDIAQDQTNVGVNVADIDGDDNEVNQEIEQGACLNAAGADDGSFAATIQAAIAAGGDDSENEASIDCS